MKRILVMMVLPLLAAAALAAPSVEQVQAQVAQGHYPQAEEMMREVLADHPESARAHYVYAEILAHDRKFDAAAEQLRSARQIAPDLGFTRPEEFRAFAALLEREQRAERSPAAQLRVLGGPGPSQLPHGGLPGWAWAAAAAAALGLLWRLLAGRTQPASLPPAAPATGPVPVRYGMAPPAGYGTAAPAGYGTAAPAGYGTAAPSAYGASAGVPAAGSGMLGTGLAAAGGVAAGMLAERLLDAHSAAGLPLQTGVPLADGSAPGLAGGEAAAESPAEELQERPIDFGSGDEWGGGAPAAGDDGGSVGSDDSDPTGGGDDGW